MNKDLLLKRLQPNQLNEINLVEMLEVVAQPAEVFALIDQSTGTVPEDMLLKREGKDLLVEVGGEVVVRIINFCAEDMHSTFSLDGSLAPEPQMAVSSDIALSENAHDGGVWTAEQPVEQTADHTDGSGHSWGWWVAGGLALAGGGAAAAGGGGGGGGGGDDGGGGGGGGSTVQTVITGDIIGGPVVSSHGLTARVYGSNGQLLGTATVNANGSYSFSIDGGYSGPVLVQVRDTNTAADYMDEGTGEAKDLVVDLRAVSTVSGDGTYTVNVNMLTELAVRELGLTGGDRGGSSTNISQITAGQISTANSNVATAFGLEGTNLTTANVVTTINANGTANAGANAYGQILAAISGMEVTEGASTGSVLNTLSTGLVNSNLSDEVKDALVEGAQTAGDDVQVSNLLDHLALVLNNDTGSSGSDGITSDGIVNVAGLETGATWQYSTNGGNTWTNGTGTSFNLAQGTYDIGDIQVRQTSTSNTGSNAGVIVIDKTPPVINSLAVSGDNVVDANDTLGAVTYNGTTTGVNNGQTVTLNIGGVTTTATVTGNAFTGTVNLSNVADGSDIAMTANVSDKAGNAAAKFSGSFDKTLVTPTINTLVVSTDNIVNTGDALNAVTYSGTTTNIENGQIVTFNIGGIAAAAIVNGNAFSGTVNLSTVADGTDLAFTANVSNAAGVAADQYGGSFDKDTVAPTIDTFVVSGDNIVDAGDTLGAVTYNGTTTGVETGQTVTLNMGGVATTATVNTEGAFSGTVNLSNVSDGNSIAMTANVSDAAENAAAQFSDSFVKDLRAPSISSLFVSADNAVNMSDNLNAVTYSGTTTNVENGQVVTLNIGGVAATATVNGNTFSGTVNLSAMVDGSDIAMTADVSDAAGNPANQFSDTFIKDTFPPSTPDLALANDTGVSNIDGITSDGTVIVSDLEAGAAWEYSIDNGVTWLTGTGTSFTLPAGAYISGRVQVRQTDAAGNTGNAGNNTSAITVDNNVPTANFSSATDNVGSVTGALTSGDTTDDTGLELFGTCESGSIVEVYNGTVKIGDATVIGTNWTYTATVADGTTYQFNVKETNATGNTSEATANFTVIGDTTAPVINTLFVSGNNIVSGSDNLSAVTFNGTTTGVEDGRTVTLSIAGVSATATVTENAFNGTVNLSAQADADDIPITADVSDAAGNPATQFSGTFDKDTTSPTIDTFVVSTDNIVNAGDTLATVAYSGTTSNVENGQVVTVNIGGVATTTTVNASGNFSGSVNLTGVSDASDINITANVSDAAGNPATQFTDTFDKDTVRPQIQSFSSNTANGTYNDGDTINITATTNESIKSGNTITATLNTGDSILLTAPGDGTTLTGTYTVGAEDNTSDLTVSSYTIGSAQDLSGNAMTSTALPASNIATTSNIIVDTTPPTTTLSGIDISADTGTSAADFITKTAAQTITATLSTGLAAGEVLYGSVDGGGTWSNITSKVSGTAVSWDGATLSGSSSIQFKVTDAAGNDGPVASQAYTLDSSAPATTLSGIDISADTGTSAADFITKTAPQTITATLSTGLAAGEVLYGSVDGGGTWSNITSKVSGTAVSWDGATLSGSSSIQFKVTDAAGNDGPVASQAYTLDSSAPATTLSGIDISADTGTSAADFITKTAAQTITATLSTGLAAGEVLYGSVDGGGTWSNITSKVSGTAVSWDGATLSGSSSIQFKVTDAAGNDGPVASQAYTLDSSAPATTLSGIDISADTGTSAADFITKTAPQTITATLSTGLAAGEVLYGSVDGGGTWSNITSKVSGTAVSWDGATLSGSSSIQFKVTDAAGNDGPVASQAYTLDSSAPTISDMSLTDATGIQNNTLNAGDIVSVTVAMDQATTVTGTPQLALNIGGTTVQANYVSGSGTTDLVFQYTIQAGQTDANGISIGTNSLSLSGGNLTDTAGNTATLTHSSVADNAGYMVDTTAPSVSSVAITSATGIQNSTLNAGDIVSVTVAMDQATTVTGTPQLNLNIGGTIVQADYVSGSGGTNLVFQYTIQATQADIDGISIDANSLSPNGGTLADAAGNTASLTHSAVADNGSYLVDTTGPFVSTVAITGATGMTGDTLDDAGDTVSVTVTMDEDTTVSGTPQLSLNIGGATKQADYVSGSGSTDLIFTYTLESGLTDADGISIDANSLSLNGGALKDGGGNDATLTHGAVGDNASYKVDTVAPYTGTDAVVDGTGIWADENGDGQKTAGETHQLTGTELSTWLTGGGRTIEFDGTPGALNLNGFGDDDKIEISKAGFSAMFGSSWSISGHSTGTKSQFWTGIAVGPKGLSTRTADVNLWYGTASNFANTLALNVGTLTAAQISFVI